MPWMKKYNVHERVKLILRDAIIPGGAVFLTCGDGIKTKSWLVDFLQTQLQVKNVI